MGSINPPPLSALSSLIFAHSLPENASLSHSNSQSNELESEEIPEYRVSGNDPGTASNSSHTALALQVQHNLQYQHNWTSLRLHTHSQDAPYRTLPRPLLSGLPPTRLYVHPDQQAVEIVQQKAYQARKDVLPDADKKSFDAERVVEHEWVLPTHLREKWSLRQFAQVFDVLGAASPAARSSDEARHGAGASGSTRSEAQAERKTQRVLLAMLSDDSTINYYIVHDGIVKPRQN